MSIEFADVERPVLTKTDNPFTTLAATLNGDRKATKAFTIALPAKAETDGKKRTVEALQDAAIGKVQRQLSQAGATAGCTLRRTVERTGTKTEPSATFTVWATDKYADRGVSPADE